MVNAGLMQYRSTMAAVHTPTKERAQGACKNAASGDRKVGGFGP
jgi:hypothetical protein